MHHAYLYEGPLSLLSALAESARDMTGLSGEGNPDVHILEWEKFGIDESRELVSEASFKSVSGRGLFVIGVSSVTPEAQGALLKLFEEPQEGVVFVLLAPPGAVMSTLRSRFLNYPETLEQGTPQAAAAKKFLASPYKERSMQITALLKDEEMAKERVRDFLGSLEASLYAKFRKEKDIGEYRVGLADIALVRGYAGDRSAALKMLLEHLAATLPTI